MLERDQIKYLLVLLLVVSHAYVHLRENIGYRVISNEWDMWALKHF